jgi:hypothetical protein
MKCAAAQQALCQTDLLGSKPKSTWSGLSTLVGCPARALASAQCRSVLPLPLLHRKAKRRFHAGLVFAGTVCADCLAAGEGGGGRAVLAWWLDLLFFFFFPPLTANPRHVSLSPCCACCSHYVLACAAADGRAYYHNRVKGISVWERCVGCVGLQCVCGVWGEGDAPQTPFATKRGRTPCAAPV